jgi:hypothetical protein
MCICTFLEMTVELVTLSDVSIMQISTRVRRDRSVQKLSAGRMPGVHIPAEARVSVSVTSRPVARPAPPTKQKSLPEFLPGRVKRGRLV